MWKDVLLYSPLRGDGRRALERPVFLDAWVTLRKGCSSFF